MKDKKVKQIPFGRSVILSVLAFVLAVGGYGGYRVVKNYDKGLINLLKQD